MDNILKWGAGQVDKWWGVIWIPAQIAVVIITVLNAAASLGILYIAWLMRWDEFNECFCICLAVNSACHITRTSWRASRTYWRQRSSESASRMYLVISSTIIQDKEKFLVTSSTLLKRLLKAILTTQRAQISIRSVLLLHPHYFFLIWLFLNGSLTSKAINKNKGRAEDTTQYCRSSLHTRYVRPKEY